MLMTKTEVLSQCFDAWLCCANENRSIYYHFEGGYYDCEENY
jgi:hypothetical protein